MRCLIGFFGLTRSLRHTIGSIRDNFYEPLDRAGLTWLSAGHFNLPAVIDNPRSQESGIPVDPTESDLLGLDLRWIEKQAERNIESHFTIASLFPDHFGDGYRSLANLCQQLHSLNRLWSLLQLFGPEEDDCFLFLRPDLFYIDKLDPGTALAPLREGRTDIVVPEWQSWGGLNDRFAFCTRHGAEIYATRIRSMIDACTMMGGVHSERMLAFLTQQHGLRVMHTSMRALRVRANGIIAGNDMTMMQASSAAEPVEARV